MTNLFGFNITENKDNTVFDGEIFCTKTIDEQLETEIENAMTDEFELEMKSSLKFPFSLIKTISLLGWMISAVAMVSVLEKGMLISEGYKNAPVIFWIFPVCFIVWLILFIASIRRQNEVINSPEYQQHSEKAEQFLKACREELGIPDDAIEVDVLAENYKIKNGEPKRVDSGLTQYVNYMRFTYIREDKLCLADVLNVLEIPLSSLSSMKLVKKRVSFPDWNKDEPVDSEKYKPFKITTNNFSH